jgi:MerR family transcriptional regulator, copper efflux regulator
VPQRPPEHIIKVSLDPVVRSGVYTCPMPAATADEKLTIGRLARVGGVNLETVRYYEREGLLPKPPRTTSGYRMFPPDAARRLRFIKRAQELGSSLGDIRELLSLRMQPGTGHADVRSRAQAKIADIERKIRTLQRMKRTLGRLTDRCEACPPSGACPILQSLDDNEGLE